MRRRDWLKAALATSLVGIAGCRGSTKERPLTVVGWGGSSPEADRKAYYAPFTRATGIPLQEDSWHGGLGVIRTKVLGGDSSWDVVAVETEDRILAGHHRASCALGSVCERRHAAGSAPLR